MTTHYVSNGQGNVDYGWILKSTGKQAKEDYTAVIDELSNTGDEFEVTNNGIVEISKADYDNLLQLNKAFNYVDMSEAYGLRYDIEQLLNKYIQE